MGTATGWNHPAQISRSLVTHWPTLWSAWNLSLFVRGTHVGCVVYNDNDYRCKEIYWLEATCFSNTSHPPGAPPRAGLLHSPSLVAIGLSMWYETWPPITLLWLVGLKIDWDCLVPHCIMGSRDHWESPLFFRPQWQSLCTALKPVVRAVQGDCEIV